MEFVGAGLSIIPLKLDGSKKPNLSSWQPYQCRLPSSDQVKQWFSRKAGIGIITGIVSGGLEVLDFDDGSLFFPWYKAVENIACRLPIVETPSGGYHIFFRCNEICGNQKIACDPERSKQTMIETRGQGGFVVGVGSPAKCHATNLPYVQVMGPVLPEIPRIAIDERKELWRAARTFDKRPIHQEALQRRAKELRRKERSEQTVVQGTPWADFDARGDWRTILEPIGWQSRDGIHWIRAGKTEGISAKVNVAANGQEVLSVFSSNAGPLAPPNGSKSWGKSDAYCLLHHAGDRRESARALKKNGFGGTK